MYVTGSSDGIYSAGNPIYDFVTVKYAIWPPPVKLVIQRATPEAVRICWTTNAWNYVLEAKDQLSTNVSWTLVETPVGIEGSNYCTTNSTDNGNAWFYRLRAEN